jgi:UDP-N-acetyl-D-galactosamine dehydrogenase
MNTERNPHVPDISQNTRIAVIGLGYVGLPLAVQFGKTYSVTGYDLSNKRIEQLKQGNDHTRETTPQELA